jgi:hypothetical protein
MEDQMAYKIYCVDFICGGKDLENVRFEGNAQEVQKELFRLQEGYCEDETPRVRKVKNGFVSESNCDFGYFAKPIDGE